MSYASQSIITPLACARLAHTPATLCEQLNIARRLIGHHARVGLVHQATHLPWGVVAGLYRELHGTPPPRGQMRHSCGRLVSNRRGQMVSSAFAVRFLALAGPRPRAVSADHWLQAYEEWRALTVPRFHAMLTVNDAWRIAEDLRLGAWYGPDAASAAVMYDCEDCGRPYLVSAESRLTRDCPYCHVLAQSYAWRPGARRTKRQAAAADHAHESPMLAAR